MTGFKNKLFYVKIDKSIQINLCKNAIKKAGSEKELCALLKIPASTFYYYKKAVYQFPQSRYLMLINYLDLEELSFDFELVEGNESRRKGGLAAYSKYKNTQYFEETHKKIRKHLQNT